MFIILAILKWIGIILLSLVILILFIASLLLFVPVRYYIEGKYAEEKYLYIKAVYLLHALKITYSTEDDVTLYVFGHPLGGRKRKRKRKREKPNNPKSLQPPQQKATEENSTEQQPIEKPDHIKVKEQEKPSQNKIKEDVPPKTNKTKNNFSFDTISGIISFIRDEEHKRVVRLFFKILKKVLSYTGPQKVKVYVKFGFEDPSNTGLVLGGISLLPIVYHKGVQIIPDFEEAVFEADGTIRGRIRMYRLLYYFCRVYFNQDNKNFIRECMEMKEELTNGR